jgi:hypothetical protein
MPQVKNIWFDDAALDYAVIGARTNSQPFFVADRS